MYIQPQQQKKERSFVKNGIRSGETNGVRSSAVLAAVPQAD